MTAPTLKQTRFHAGVWHGELTGTGPDHPVLHVTHQGVAVDGITFTHDAKAGLWRVAFPVPPGLISEGVQTFLISDEDGRPLASFVILAGEALAGDIRAEVDLLRAELDLLKRAFRRHCQTNQPFLDG
ncbi:hypothetical protein [Yoonia sp.]|uniref:hypothetical protein n=1 Tax=Yoonia sp. TaxID=2212373 RepID=UPI0019D8F356|nr:hypothetical protein [Yoonia sp.]MBE0412010.1 hypothetical protein [Yoonia sp.]